MRMPELNLLYPQQSHLLIPAPELNTRVLQIHSRSCRDVQVHLVREEDQLYADCPNL